MARKPLSRPSGDAVSTLSPGVFEAIAGTTRSMKRWSMGIRDLTNTLLNGL